MLSGMTYDFLDTATLAQIDSILHDDESRQAFVQHAVQTKLEQRQQQRTQSISIRPIQTQDIAGFRAALDSVAKERKYISTLEAPALEQVTNFVNDNITKHYPQYVVLDDDLIVGWADIIPHQRESEQHIGTLGMGIMQGYRGQGIGNRLLAAVIAAAWDYGMKRLELEVFAHNLTAIQLYRKHGYQYEGIKRHAYHIDGHYGDIIMMAQYRL